MTLPMRLAGLGIAAALACLPAAPDVPKSRHSMAATKAQAPALKEALAKKGLELGDEVFLQITKSPAELTAFVNAGDGQFVAFRTWPICSVSGTLGPKRREGDGQAPEGFYSVKPAQLNPASSYHLSFNLGYPNAFDRAHKRTGSALMVHGNCVSIGCFAMTDPVIEEIWTLMQAAFDGGQGAVPVHIFPFAMTPEALAAQKNDPNKAFWESLAPAWTQFEATGRVPRVRVVGKSYVVSAAQ